MERPRVGISACLLGVPVRYDGDHRREDFLVDQLGPHVDWVQVCPEVEIGLGTPRPPIDLHETEDPARPRLFRGDPRRGQDALDLTETMRSYAEARVAKLQAPGLDGFVLKARSPSCGLRQVKLVKRSGEVVREGTGLFARALREIWPWLAVFDETELEAPAVREARIEWIVALHRFRLRESGPAGLLAFHRAHTSRIRAHDPGRLAELDALAACGGDVAGAYRDLLSAALGRLPTRRGHVNALLPLAESVAGSLPAAERAALMNEIETHSGEAERRGILGRLRGLAREQGQTELLGQTYLNPHPSLV